MKKALLLFTVLLFGIAGIANADLIVKGTDTAGNQLIYDTDLNITWYDYSSLLDTWHNQMEWAEGLSIDFNGVTLDEWRLPKILDGYTYNPASSEMGHLYYEEFGLLSFSDRDDTEVTESELNESEFNNLVAGWYWANSKIEIPINNARAFNFSTGSKSYGSTEGTSVPVYALAVYSGDVPDVPIPGGIYLLGTGLAGLVGIRRRLKM